MSALGWMNRPTSPEERRHLADVVAATEPAGRVAFTPYYDPDLGATVVPPDADPVPGVTADGLRAAELGIVRLDRVVPSEPAPLIVGRLAPDAHTILFGDGDVGKGTLACQWITDAVEDGHVVLILDYEAHRDEWTWRLDGLGGRTVRESVHHANASTWGGPLWDHLEQLRLAVAVTGADILVVDSLAVACQGSDPKDDETASRYCAAVNGLGLSVLSIAHVTKAGESRWPYGSVFWHNLARVTWSLARHRDGRLLRCRKANAYRKPPSSFVTVTWDGTRLREVWQQPYADVLGEAILDVLIDKGPLSHGALVSALEEGREEDAAPVQPGHVSTALQRLKKAGKVDLEGDRWRAA